MRAFTLLIALALIVTIGGVYATWIYPQSTDVKDVTSAKAITMTEATFTGTEGTYTVDPSGLTLQVDPKEGTTHITALKITGELVIKFEPNTYADPDVHEFGVPSTFEFGLSNDNWTFRDQKIIEIIKPGQHEITWQKVENQNYLIFVIKAEDLAEYFALTEFDLEDSTAYDAYDLVLTKGQITVHVSDGQYNAPEAPAEPEV